MPAFDPVRDAASVSPTTSNMMPLPTPLPPPSPTRRASSLSMLLNADTPDDSRPGSSSSTYSQNSLYGSPFPVSSNGFPKPSLSSIDTANLARQPSQSPTMQPRSALVPASPLSMLIHPNLPPHAQSPTLSTRRSPYPPPGALPSNHNSYFPPLMPPPSAIPYQPLQQKRKSRTDSVLDPITTEELRRLKSSSRNSLRRDPAPVASSSHLNGSPYLQPNPLSNSSSNTLLRSPPKRKYESDASPTSEQQEHERTAKRSRDTLMVASHYNSRAEVGLQLRQESPILGLKNFNNWIKSVLISKFAASALQQSPYNRGGGRMRGKVLDMGCGKGGDLQKWQKAGVVQYVGVDIADVSVDQARERWKRLRQQPRFDAEFAALDCYNYPLSSKLSPEWLSTPFDAVSMQFCMHYAFENAHKARTMLDNVSRWLRDGGMFIGTIPSPDRLLQNLRSLPPSDDLSWGNSLYEIKFDDHNPPRGSGYYGHRYSFFLKDAVEDVPEYVVYWEDFVRLAVTYDLHLCYRQDFHDIFHQERNVGEYASLLKQMKVTDHLGNVTMDPEQWEATNVYLGFAFEKRRSPKREDEPEYEEL